MYALHHGMIGTLVAGTFQFEAIGIYVAFLDVWARTGDGASRQEN